jgi:hypothetical protein
VNDNIITLRLVSFAMSLATLMVIEAYLMTRTRPALAVLFTSMVAFSPYFLGVAVRLLTDNLALGAAIAALFVLDDAFELNAVHSVSGAFLSVIAVLTRQIYLWLAPMQFLATFSHKDSRRSQRILNVLLSAAPLLALLPFLLIWHGLTPLSWAGWSSTAALAFNLDVPIFILSLLGLFGSVFILTMIRGWRSSACRRTYAALFAGLGVLTLLLHPFTIARGGWLLAAGRVTPQVHGTPPVFWILLPLGLVYLYVLVARQRLSGSYFIVIALILWMLVNSVSGVVFQRYYEPMLIFIIAYTLAPLDFESFTEWLMPSAYLFGCIGLDVLQFYYRFR